MRVKAQPHPPLGSQVTATFILQIKDEEEDDKEKKMAPGAVLS
jgi:hypothetical protein